MSAPPAPDRQAAVALGRYVARRALPLLFRLTPRTRAYRLRSWLLRAAGYQVDRSARCVSTVEFHSPGVSLAADSFCAHEVRFFGGPGSTIAIGEGVQIGPQTVFVARSHHIGPPSRRAGAAKETSIEVGAGVWIGARAVVVGPCRIGAGSVVAAGAVVRGDVPPNVVTFGTPIGAERPLADGSGDVGQAGSPS